MKEQSLHLELQILSLKLNAYSFRGSNCYLHICFPFQEGFTLRGKNLLLLEQILSFKRKPQFEIAMSAREANRKS